MPSKRIGFVVAVLAALVAHSQDERWRQRNDRGNRYEGARSELVAAAPVVDLIGFHGYRTDFRPADDVTLTVSFYVPRAGSAVHLTAQEIVPEELYWMEAKPTRWLQGWNRFGPWPVKDVLRRKVIGSDNLAVLVRLDGARSGGGEIAPAVIQKVSEAVEITEYRLHLKSGKALESVAYNLESVPDGVVRRRGTLGGKPGGVPFTVILPVGRVSARSMRLELSCKIKGQSGPPAHVIYIFQHEPRAATAGAA